MSQLANRAELMILCETGHLKLRMRPLMRPGIRKPKIKNVSWSDQLITEYIIYPEIRMTEKENDALTICL